MINNNDDDDNNNNNSNNNNKRNEARKTAKQGENYVRTTLDPEPLSGRRRYFPKSYLKKDWVTILSKSWKAFHVIAPLSWVSFRFFKVLEKYNISARILLPR